MLDQMCASIRYCILGIIGDLHDHHQRVLPEPRVESRALLGLVIRLVGIFWQSIKTFCQ